MDAERIKYKTTIHRPPQQAGIEGETKQVPPHVARKLVDDSHGLYAERVLDQETEPRSQKPEASNQKAKGPQVLAPANREP